MTFDLSQRIRDEFPGTPDDEIPGLIRMLRLLRPDDQLRIERNYYRTLSMERAEEALIWRRRFEGPNSPSVEDVLSDLQARVSAATSVYAREQAAVPKRAERQLTPAQEVQEPWATVGPGCVSPTPPQQETLPALELQAIRRQLGLSRAAMAYRVRVKIAKLALYEQGGTVPPEFMQLAREQLL